MYAARQFDNCTPTFIEVGAGSFQDGMPIMMCESPRAGTSAGSTGVNASKGLSGASASASASHQEDNLIETLADAMNEASMPSFSNGATAAAIAANHKHAASYNKQQQQYQLDSCGLIAPSTSKYGSKSPAIAISTQATNSDLPNPDKSSVMIFSILSSFIT